MKTKILLLILFTVPLIASAQFEKGDKGTMFLVVKQKDNTPVAFEEVSISEKSSSTKSTNYTDKNGNVQFTIMLGYVYVVNFKDAPHFAEFAIPLNRGNMITSQLVYNPPKKKNTATSDTIWQNTGPKEDNTNASVSIRLSNKKTGITAKRKTCLDCSALHKVYAGYTDANGLVQFVVPVNREFAICVEHQYGLATLDTRTQGGHLTIKKTIPYDPSKVPEKSLNMSHILSDTVVQVLTENDQPNAGESIVEIKTESMNKTGVANIPVRLICTPIKKIFIARTDATGTARFIVPVDKMYWAGVDDYNDIEHVIVPKEDRMTITFSFTYEPTNITEINKNDTITQQLPEWVHATTARSYCHIIIRDYEQKLLADEPVFLKESVSGKVFKATTNPDGSSDFLLPKGKKYYISFKYENNIDVLEVPSDKGFRKNTMDYMYRGSKNIEDYYAKSDRDKNGFFKKFMESKTTPIDVTDKQFAEKTALGFKLNLPAGSPISTPALAGDEMITSEGYYSPHLYGFDSRTGHTDWGISLAEGGASNAVYDDGVVIVNTESCTLYAIDSKSGKLLWSKWLSNYLYTTPSIDNGKIYTVYANNLDYANGNHSFVLICLDLHSGDIVWQDWLDANAMASPVIDRGRVYVTTVEGKLCLFDSKDGKLIKESRMDATTNPLIINDKLYISTHNHDKNVMETVNILDANNLTVLKKMTWISGKYNSSNNLSHSTIADMNFAGTRMVNYKGRNYNVMGNKVYCTSPDDGKVFWSSVLNFARKDSSYPYATMPVVAGGKVIIGTPDGKIRMFDPVSGRVIKEYTVEGDIWAQPMVHNGWIYASTREGKLVSIDTHDATLTGWDMWNYSPRHNTSVE
jgi:outer membrane protein assembly factor BamB